MSFSSETAHSFLAPLLGKTATLLMEDRRSNLAFARTLGAVSAGNFGCAIFDLDAFYSSSSDFVFPLSPPNTFIGVPEPGADLESEFSRIFETNAEVVLVDSLNSFYHLISLEDGSSRGRKLAFAVSTLSYFARSNGRAVILTMYRREGLARGGSGRSISDLSDITASVSVTEGNLAIKTVRGQGWPRGAFSTRVP